MEKNLKRLGVFGIISLLSYTAMVVFSPLAYPGYDWLSMAVSDLCAEGAPSEALASQLNALFGPCALVSVMAVCVGITGCKVRPLKLGIYCFAAMEWVCNVGYEMFPWVSGATATEPQNVMHYIVTVLIVVLSLAALILIIIGAKGKNLTALKIWAIICLAAMLIGPAGTALLPKTVFGLFERFGTFSAVVFNAVLGISMMKGTLYFPAFCCTGTQSRRVYCHCICQRLCGHHSAGLLYAAYHGTLWRPDKAGTGTVGFSANEPLFQL